MKNFISSLKKEEQVLLELRKLYEQLAYKKIQLSKFEDYDLYIQHKHVLDSDGILSFTDHTGKLLALRPDATLSLLRNSKEQGARKWDKLYYIEQIYRRSSQSGEFKEITQLGVECFNTSHPYSKLEIIHTAIQSLETLHDNYVLSLSHLGFLEGILTELKLNKLDKKEIMLCIAAKNTHDLERLIPTNTPTATRQSLLACSKLYGSFETVMAEAQAYVIHPLMTSALTELSTLYSDLKKQGMASKVLLDFSLTANLDYYNGFIFHGYIENIPQYLLSGGQYDQLAKKFGHQHGAIGFAISMSELNGYYPSQTLCDFDVLLSVSQSVDLNTLVHKVQELNAQGLSVRVSKNESDKTNYTYSQLIELS